MSVAYVFPGQGTQYVGMGTEFYRDYAKSKEIIEMASESLGYSVEKLLFEENDRINQTQYTQVAILTTSICMLEALKERVEKPDIVAGLSLGEYSALVCNGTFQFSDAVKLVSTRGKMMQEAVPTGMGAMAAIIKVDAKRISEICAGVIEDTNQLVEISNYNCPGQYVIAGEKKAVELACDRLRGEARLVQLLNISVPSHCGLMKTMSENFRGELAKYRTNSFDIPYIANSTAEIVTDVEKVKDLLVKQLYLPVLWEQSIEKMIESGVTKIVEVGPGKVLTKYVSRIDRKIEAVSSGKVFSEYNLKE